MKDLFGGEEKKSQMSDNLNSNRVSKEHKTD